MKSLKVTSLICGGILSFTGISLLAQTSSSSSPSSSSSQSSSSLGSGSSSQSSSSLGSSSSSMHSGKAVRLSQIMNGSVQGQDGKTLGNIRDLIVDPQSGRIEFAILSLSSAGGVSDTSTSGRETVPSSRSSTTGTPSSASGSSTTGKLIPVPWQLFSQSMSSHTSSSSTSGSSSMSAPNLTLSIDESKLQSAPSFDASNWNELQSGSFGQRAYSYFGVDRSSALGTSGSSISGQGSSGSSSSSSSPSSSSSSSSNPDK